MPFIQFQFRRGTASEWTAADPTLAAGELGIETDTAQFKIGNGSTIWSSLPYGGIQGPPGAGGVVVAASAPGAPQDGDLWYDTVNLALKVYYNSAWRGTGTYV